MTNILEPVKNTKKIKKSAYELITSPASGWAALTYLVVQFNVDLRGSRTHGTRTNEHQDKWAPDKWAPGQMGGVQLG